MGKLHDECGYAKRDSIAHIVTSLCSIIRNFKTRGCGIFNDT